ncbi:MAG: site-specific DNA-methyltransferase [Promethearchaeota archaeon]
MEKKRITEIKNKDLLRLQQLLQELFEIEPKNLDFEIYRVINIQRKEILQYIVKELPEIIEEGINAIKIENCDTRSKIEVDLYNNIFDFFSQYYNKGNFSPKRRYTKEKHHNMANNGEEVYLYWANYHQYYIKSAKNVSDYFIHKHLKRFLEEELKSYIKNSFFKIEDIYNLNLLKIKINLFRKICQEIIKYLAYIEEIQKKLWTKKSFILSTDYLITLDLIDERFYPEILTNKEQLHEWQELLSFNIEEKIKTGIDNSSIEILKKFNTLAIDTKFYSKEFKYRILSEIDNIDENVNGLLLHSNNFQALNLLLKKYGSKINCAYIDPPYNTRGNEFPYKDKYRHSSWLSMMKERLELIKDLLSEDGVYFISIDDNELANLTMLVESIFTKGISIGPIIVQVNPGGRDYLHIAKTHEYIVSGLKDKEKGKIYEVPKEEIFKYKDSRGGWNPRGLRNRNPRFNRLNRPNLFYPIYINPNLKDSGGYAPVSVSKSGTYSIEILPRNSKGVDDCWRWGKGKLSKNIVKDSSDLSNVVAYIKKDGKWRVMEKSRKSTKKIKSIWTETSMRTEDGTRILRKLFGNNVYSHPKPIDLIKRCLSVSVKGKDLVIDCFAGSGTTGQAVLDYNKETNQNLKFILIEMGKYFDDVLKKRILKVIYSNRWKDGKPLDHEGSMQQIIKYQILEQFEDCLNNITLDTPKKLNLESEDNKVKYLLKNIEDDNNLILNLCQLEKPFEFTLNIAKNDEIKELDIDFIETFNYIAGVTIRKIYKTKHNNIEYFIIEGTREDKNSIVIWRNKNKNLELKAEKEFIEQNVLKNVNYDEIFVNSTSLINGARSLDSIFIENMFKWE